MTAGAGKGRTGPGWWQTLGAVFLASVVAYGVGSLVALVAPERDRYLVARATWTVTFLVVLWLLALYLIPGRRPRSMPMPWASIAGSVVAGLLIGTIAIGCTWAYLASITIDDGLEAMVLLPILGAAGVVVGLVARATTARFRPVLASAAGCVGIAIFLSVRQWSRSGHGVSILAIPMMTVLVLFPLAVCGVAIGTLVGDALRPRVRRSAP